MKCQNCGAEIGTNKYCEYCGSQITPAMQKERDQLNKEGCPKCGSANVQFRRENQGEIKKKKGNQYLLQTVGFCNDCGFTWYPNGKEEKRKTWLWVLGWLFIFPIPLTLIMLKKENLKKGIRYVIIVVAWLLYIAFLLGNKTNTNTIQPHINDTIPAVTSNNRQTVTEEETNSDKTIPQQSQQETTYAVTKDESETEYHSTESESVTAENGIRPEIKEAIDSYEEFVDEYCSFMESYDATDFSLLSKYAALLSKEAEMTEKFDSLEKDLTDAESLYYTEVSLRCSQKLLKSAESIY